MIHFDFTFNNLFERVYNYCYKLLTFHIIKSNEWLTPGK